MTRDDILEEADNEGELNVAIDALADRDEITLEDLRTLPNTQDLSDEELLKVYQEAQNEGSEQGSDAAAVAAATGAETAVKTSRGWKLYDDKGEEIGDYSKLTVDQFLKSKIGYNANKGEHKKSFDELLRVAQFGHLNEAKLGTVTSERNAALKELNELKPFIASSKQSLAAVNYAVTQFAMGNQEPLAQFVEAVKKNAGMVTQTQAPSAPASNPAESGLQVYHTEILPHAYEVADRYGVKHNEMKVAIDQFLANEPNLTKEKLDQYIEVELPMHIEAQGYALKAPSAPPAGSAAAYEARIAALEARLSAKPSTTATQNSVTKQVINRNRNIAGAGPRDSMDTTAADGQVVPANALKSGADFKAWLKES